jgi:hypothetical protein
MDAIRTETRPIPPKPIVTAPQARLPGEDDRREAEALHAPTPDAADRPPRTQPTRSRRKTLLVTVAIVAAIGIVTGASYEERVQLGQLPVIQRLASTPMAHRLFAAWPVKAATPTPSIIASKDVASPWPIGGPGPTGAPTPYTPTISVHAAVSPVQAASAASVPSSDGAAAVVATSSHPVAAQGPGPAVPSATPAADVPKPFPPNAKQADLREIDALRSTTATPAATAEGGSPTPAGTPPISKPAVSVAPGPVTVPVGAAPVLPTSPASSAKAGDPGSAKIASASPHLAPALPEDPVAQAGALKPTPLTPPQQVDLLHLTTEMGVVVRDLRTENAELRNQVTRLSSEMDSRLTQFDRRLSLAEAKGAIAAAMGAGQVPVTPSAVATTPSVPATDRSTSHPAASAASPLVRSVKDYSIQAASPGLAMLSTVNGDATNIQVSAGDKVPGVGRVKAIFQRGTQWVVETDHGMIR